MSKALVKKALELCDDQVPSKQAKKSNKKVKRNRSGLNDEVLFNKKGKKSKTLIETFMANKDKSNLRNNLKYLKKMSKIALKYDQVKSVIAPSKPESQTTKPAEQSVFTEEDFKSFEKTYFNKK